MNNKANPEELAKVIIWNLVSLRDEMAIVDTRLELLCEHFGVETELDERFKKQAFKDRRAECLKILAAVGIEAGATWPPHDPQKS